MSRWVAAKTANAIAINQGPLVAPPRPRSFRDVALSLNSGPSSYEARLAERRYKAIDPDNRVVARTLEREWNDKLQVIEQLVREREAVRQREKVEITDTDRARILELARNLSTVWDAPTTTHAERKTLLRMLVREVTVSRVDVPCAMTRVQVLWQTGTVSDFTIERRDKYTARATAPQAIAFIRTRK